MLREDIKEGEFYFCGRNWIHWIIEVLKCDDYYSHVKDLTYFIGDCDGDGVHSSTTEQRDIVRLATPAEKKMFLLRSIK